jgi:cytochrome P450
MQTASISRLSAVREVARLIDNPVEVLQAHTRAVGPTYAYPIGGLKRVLVSSDPVVLRRVLKDNAANYHKSEFQTRRLGRFMGTCLLTSHGDAWLRQRRVIQRGFNPDQLARLAPGMQAAVDERLAALAPTLESGGPVDVCEVMHALAFAMITRSIFAASLTDEESAQIHQAIGDVQAFVLREAVQPHLAPWFRMSGELRRRQAQLAASEAILARYIALARADPAASSEILRGFFRARIGDRPMSEEEILREVVGLLIAGHETSSNTLSWALWLLARHPARLAAVRAELAEALAGGPVTCETLPRLRVTGHVLEEALRLFPPFWMVDRVALRDDVAGGVDIPAGTTVIAFIYGAQHAAEGWDEPESFQPERFDGDDKAIRRSYRHLPFGGGPRACVGAGYAVLQMAMALAEIVRRYDFELEPGACVEAQPLIVLRPRGGIRMRFRPAG